MTCGATVGRTAETAREALALQIDSVAISCEACRAGLPLDEVVNGLLVRGGSQIRRNAARAIQEYEHAVLIFRSELTRHLVDEMSLTLTAAAERMGVARQTASHLYHAAPDLEEGERGQPPDQRPPALS